MSTWIQSVSACSRSEIGPKKIYVKNVGLVDSQLHHQKESLASWLAACDGLATDCTLTTTQGTLRGATKKMLHGGR